MTTTTGHRPSIEQLEQIRALSEIVLGHRGLAFKHHGMPATREDAADLLRQLHAARRYEERDDTVDGRECPDCGQVKPAADFQYGGRTGSQCGDCIREAQRDRNTIRQETTVTKTCTNCGESKPADDFHKGHNQCKTCRREKNRANYQARKTRAEGSGQPDPTEPTHLSVDADEPPAPETGWEVFTDPRLSDLEKLKSVVVECLHLTADNGYGTEPLTLDHVADLATAIGTTFRPKEAS